MNTIKGGENEEEGEGLRSELWSKHRCVVKAPSINQHGTRLWWVLRCGRLLKFPICFVRYLKVALPEGPYWAPTVPVEVVPG
jgi:hypothetical protein